MLIFYNSFWKQKDLTHALLHSPVILTLTTTRKQQQWQIGHNSNVTIILMLMIQIKLHFRFWPSFTSSCSGFITTFSARQRLRFVVFFLQAGPNNLVLYWSSPHKKTCSKQKLLKYGIGQMSWNLLFADGTFGGSCWN